MSYDSTNTTVLATCEQAGGNTRMLLLHTCGNGRREYIVGSYFRQETVCEPFGPAAFPTKYSWDWGHYFGDVVSAVEYWKEEVLGARDAGLMQRRKKAYRRHGEAGIPTAHVYD